MAKRASNRERIARRAAEAKISAEEKTAAKKTVKKKAGTVRSRRKKADPAKRMKFVWKVFNDNFKEVACFPYPEKEAADAKAAQLTKKTGKEHFVNSIKVPMADDE